MAQGIRCGSSTEPHFACAVCLNGWASARLQLGMCRVRCISGINACGDYSDAKLATVLLPATQAGLTAAAASAAAEQALAAERLQHQQATIAAAATAQAEMQRLRDELSAALHTAQETQDAMLAASRREDAAADAAAAAASERLSALQALMAAQTAQTAQAVRAAAQSERWIQDNTKPCPNCGRRVEKNGGCLHMTCPQRPVGCGNEYFWCCLRPYPDARHALFNCGA
jgi:NADH pyrophosphatase NudC (nudix superfamily)